MNARLRIAVIAPLRYPISMPHAGGLESAVWNEVRSLRSRGHQVLLAAVEGSDFLEDSPAEFALPAVSWGDDLALNDVGFPPGYLETALPRLRRALEFISLRRNEFDVVINHSLQPEVLVWASGLPVPVVSTLHTPVLPELVEARASTRAHGSTFLAVSEYTAGQWLGAGVPSTVLLNAVEPDDWPLGPGGDSVVWFGRIVPEKAPHLAIDAARALGRRISIVGRVGDRGYAAREIYSRLADDVDLIGPLSTPALAALVGRSACALVTPMWHEPFGLVIPEALMCGTPVAAFDAGGIGEIASRCVGVGTAPIGDLAALAQAAESVIERVSQGSVTRAGIRDSAVAAFSLDARTRRLERILHDATGRPAAAERDEAVA